MVIVLTISFCCNDEEQRRGEEFHDGHILFLLFFTEQLFTTYKYK